jgi:hypothetical protein
MAETKKIFFLYSAIIIPLQLKPLQQQQQQQQQHHATY